MNNRLRPRAKSTTQRSLLPTDDGPRLSPRNNHFINKNAKKVRLVTPDCYKKGGTMSIRIWNMLNPENPTELLNGRTSQYDVAGLEGVSISEPVYVCNYAGINQNTDKIIGHDVKECNPVSYIIARSKERVVDGINFWEEPYVKFCKVAKDAHESGRFTANRKWDSDWNSLLASKMDKAIQPWKQIYFGVGSIYNNGPKLDLVREDLSYEKNGKRVDKEAERNGIPLGEAAEDPLPLFTLSVSTGRKLLELMSRTKETYEGDPDVDPSCMYKYGDPCGKFDAQKRIVNGGCFFHIFNPDVFSFDVNDPIHKRMLKNTTYVFNAEETASKSKNTKGGEQVTLYEAAVSSGIVGPNGLIKPGFTQEQVNNITSKHLFFWKDSDEDGPDSFLLYEPSIEERCVWIATAFKFVPKLVELCWMSNTEYLEFDSVKAVLRNRTQVRIPEYTPEPEEEQEEEPTVTKVTSTKANKPAPAAAFAESLMDDFDSASDEPGEDYPAPAIETKATKASTTKVTKPKAEELMQDFEEFDSEGEIEAESDDAESDSGVVQQFEQVESFEDEVSADFDPQPEGDEAEDADPFVASTTKSLETAKAIGRSAARNSKPKK